MIYEAARHGQHLLSTRHNISEDLNPQQHHCESLKSHNTHTPCLIS